MSHRRSTMNLPRLGVGGGKPYHQTTNQYIHCHPPPTQNPFPYALLHRVGPEFEFDALEPLWVTAFTTIHFFCLDHYSL